MVHVVKANGITEAFSEEKVITSIKRAGISKDIQAKVLAHVKEKLFDGITTSEIHNHIKEFLHTAVQPSMFAKYDLKRAIMALGPTGYPFEDYVSALLKQQGYTTKTRQIVRGKCITHEIDVIAQKEGKTTMVEAKFHNLLGTTTNIHVAMYTQARFQDTKEKNHFDNVMLITNTKITTEAIVYGQCMGMNIVSWSYPKNDSLRDWVEQLAFYPVTALSTLSNGQQAQLVQNGIVLCQDLCKKPQILSLLSLPEQRRREVMEEASFACAR